MVVFEVFGDSNVAKSWKAVASDGVRLAGSVLRQTTTFTSLRDTLKTVGQGTKAILVSAVTNPITRLKYEGVAQIKVPVLDCFDEICDLLIQTANNNPELKVMLSSVLVLSALHCDHVAMPVGIVICIISFSDIYQ
jgi:hypothetical protein